MKNNVIISFILLSLLSLSCKETINGPNDGSSEVNAKTLFVGQSFDIPIKISGGIVKDEYPQFDQWSYDYFNVGYSILTDKSEISLYINATKVSSGPINELVSFTYAKKTIYQMVSINVIDFYYASTFEKNTGDTLMLKSGTNFLLHVTCKDSAGNVVSKNTISRLVGYGTSYNTEKVFFNDVYNDTTNFSYLLSALPDLTPSPQDTGIYFSLRLSNKEFKLPIKLLY